MLGFLFVDEVDLRPGRRREGARRRRAARSSPPPATRSPRSATGTPRRSTRRCARRWSTGSGSSRATPSARCGSPSPAARVSPPLFESLELLGRERVAGAARRGARRGRTVLMSYPAGSAGAVRRAAPGPAAGHRRSSPISPISPPAPQPGWDSRRWVHPHPEPRLYPQMLRTWDYAWWKPLRRRAPRGGRVLRGPDRAHRRTRHRRGRRRWLDAVLRADDRRVQPRQGHAMEHALPQPVAGLAGAGRLAGGARRAPAAARAGCPRCCRGCGGSSSSPASAWR